MKAKFLTKVAFYTAIYCVLSPFAFYIGPIPITLSFFAVCLISSITDVKTALFSVLCYILLGVFGIPVFSGFTGGFQKLFDMSGGFIAGYIPMAFIISFFCNKFKTKKFIVPLSCLLGALVCYIIGTCWFCYITKTGIYYSFGITVLPFIPFDAVKIILSSIITSKLRKVL